MFVSLHLPSLAQLGAPARGVTQSKPMLKKGFNLMRKCMASMAVAPCFKKVHTSMTLCCMVFRLVQSVSTKIVFTCARRLVKEGKPSWARRSGENALAFLEFLSYPADGAGVLAQFPCSGTHFVPMAAS